MAGPDSRAVSTRAALSRTPTPLVLSIWQYCRLRSWDASGSVVVDVAQTWSRTCTDTTLRGSTSWARPWPRRSGTSTSSAVRRGRAGPALHRPAPHPRGDLPAGLRRAAPRRPHGTPPRPDPGDRGPQRPDPRLGQADRRPRLADPGRDAAPQRRGVRRPAAPARRRRAGHRARRRPAARPDPARHDHRLRRQPHQHPRRLRRDRLRHRHLRGRARARHPDPDAGQAEDDGRHRQRQPARRASPPRTWCSP